MKLFIDANIYLDFYEIQAVKSLLKPLIDVKDHVLVTSQIVDEVFRNKLDISNKKFVDYLKKVNVSLALPDVLTENAVAEIDEGAVTKLKELSSGLKEFKSLLEDIYSKTLEQISNNEDKVSAELMKIFNNSISYTEEQCLLAKKRKFFGNPPGKKGDPIGDEISWEQVLDCAKENNCPIWVVSKDGDFMSKVFYKGAIGNPFLLREISERGLPNFKFYSDLSTALQEFKKEYKEDLELPPDSELLAATKAQEGVQVHHDNSKCIHEMEIIRKNGAFDIWECRKCGQQHQAYSEDCCD